MTLRGANGPRRGAELRNLGIIQDGAVLIVDGRIQEVGPSRRVENLALARQADVIDATGRVVMPGFVDSHTHLVSGPARIPDYEARVVSVDETIEIARTIQELSPRTLRAQAQDAMDAAFRHGTTLLEAKSGFGITESNEIRILRVQAALRLTSTFFCAQIPADHRNRSDGYVEWLCSHMLPLVHRRKLAQFADVYCGEGGFAVDQARRFLLAARDLQFSLKVETGARPPVGAIRMAADLGATSIDHAVEIAPEDLALLAQSHTVATLLPGPAFYLGSQEYAPARKWIGAGVAVALATNYNSATSPSQNMQMAITLACGNMHMTPAEAVTAATINAAHSLRVASTVGSLEPGKNADLIILGVADYRAIPYHFGVNLVELVMRNGTVR